MKALQIDYENKIEMCEVNRNWILKCSFYYHLILFCFFFFKLQLSDEKARNAILQRYESEHNKEIERLQDHSLSAQWLSLNGPICLEDFCLNDD